MDYLLYLAIFFGCFAVLARRDLVWALALMAALLPSYIVRFSIGPVPSTALEGMTLIILFCLAWSLGRSQPSWKTAIQHVRSSAFFLPGVALVAAALIACFVSPDLRASLGIWRAYFLEPFLLYAVAINVLTTERDWRKMFIGFGCAVFGLTAIAVYQYATGSFLPTWEWTVWATRRATGTFTSPNSLGLFVVPIALLALGNIIKARKEGKAWKSVGFDLTVLAAAVLCVILSSSKGAMIAFAAGAILLTYRLINKTIWMVLAAGALIAILFIPAIDQRVSDLVTLQTASGQSRRALYAGSVQLIKQHPLAGTGLSGFAKAFETVRPEGFTEKLIYPHDIFLNFWLETGLLGLLSVFWIIVVATKQVWSNRQNIAVLAIGAALLAMLIHGLVDVPYFKNDLAMLTWLLLAALAVHSARRK